MHSHERIFQLKFTKFSENWLISFVLGSLIVAGLLSATNQGKWSQNLFWSLLRWVHFIPGGILGHQKNFLQVIV